MKLITRSLNSILSIFLLLGLLLILPDRLHGQQSASSQEITGKVIDEQGQPLIGATVIVDGDQSRSTVTKTDGTYSVNVPSNLTSLTFSYVGYQSQTIAIASRTAINITMVSQSTKLDDVVVVGYGTQRKSDLTGSVATVSSKDFNQGMVGSAEGLINGKVAGVQIVSNGGSPTAGSTIRIRGGASLNASNDPLIVLDGVPLETGGISGNSGNFLSLINPADIESITILKDASSTAIYGSRASNGVMIITTKKGSKKLMVNFSTTNSLQYASKTANVLSADELRSVIGTEGTAAQKSLLSDGSTNWSDEIFRTAFGTDNTISVSGSVTDNLPFRVSAGYYNQNGILLKDNVERYTGNLSLSPTFFDDYLKVNVNVKGTINKNRFANGNSIYSAAAYNPTLGVRSGNDEFGGWNEALNETGTPSISGQVFNPVGLLEGNSANSDVKRVVGNVDVDYRMHFLPDLKAHVTLGYDYAQGKGSVYVPDHAAQLYTTGGRDYTYGPETKSNQLLTFYLNYNKNIESIRSRIDVTAGYDYQKWAAKSPAYDEVNVAGAVQTAYAASDQRHVLLSMYGRLNYTLADKYMLTATVRRDGSSRFSPDNRWSTFPSVALAWRISEENFLKNSRTLSNLKLRLSYGETGQQDGIGNYGYIPMYTISQNGAQYPFGNSYYYTYRPEAYVSDLKWESTQSYNAGIDFGFLNNRISGSVDYYNRKTRDLLATVPSPAGVNFDKQITTNVGNMQSDGLEFTLNATPVSTKDWSWDISYNLTWQKVRITNLSLVKGTKAPITYVGLGLDNTYVQIMREGYAPYTYYVYKQVYDQSGKPIEGMFADLSGDGKINTEDLYCANSPNPDFLMGLSSQLRYKRWNMGFSLRASLGNYAYNGTAMNMGALGTVSYNAFQLNNLSSSYLSTGFKSRQYLSDYYIEDASFLKMDNLTLGYDFGNVSRFFKLRVTAMVQNVFTITNYSGVDPEIYNGIESSFYPRARTFSLSLGLDF